MTSLIEFLEARLKDDQEAAERMAAAYPEPWNLYDRGWMFRIEANEPGWLDVVRLEQRNAPEGLEWLAGAIEHVAMHSPARVLREVTAKRRVMARHCPDLQPYTLHPEAPPYAEYCRECENNRLDDCPELRDLAAVYFDHADWREEWRP